jgi:hypothetical protein
MLESLRVEQYKLKALHPLHPRPAPCPHCTGNVFAEEPAEDQKIGVYCIACNTVRCILSTKGELKHFYNEVLKVEEAIKKNGSK